MSAQEKYTIKMHGPLIFEYILIFSLLLISSMRSVGCEDEQRTWERNYQTDDVDEGSCVCGLSKAVLDRLELIVRQANKQECSLVSNVNQAIESTSETPAVWTPDVSQNHHNDTHQSQTTPTARPNQQEESTVASNESTMDQRRPTQSSQISDNSSTSDLMSQIQALQAQIASLRPVTEFDQQAITSTTETSAQRYDRPQMGTSSSSTGNLIQPSVVITTQTISQQTSSNGGVPQDPRPDQQPQVESLGETSGFLLGLASSSDKPNIQTQEEKLETNEVQQAVVTTVPNVVSNIFTNIQDFAIQTEKNPNNVAGSTPVVTQLTSIDGSSAQLNNNDTAAQITAQGEQLFLQWIEHQIQAYHMTASMAAYIRKSALNLFRRIVKQYVQRIERLGGAVEGNVRQATQLALHNTQTLISFLMRNYLNFAGGLMQIIGEQVSRVGKQLDSTGETIAHINLNPFDIVSNVIDSLPNPSRYSEYFRAFGKYLMGEPSSSHSDDEQQGQSSAQQDQQGTDTNKKRKGLFSKTMGALGKTFSSWIG